MVFTFHQILLFSFSVELLSQKMFANVACFNKFYVISSLVFCGYNAESEKYVGSPLYLTALNYHFFLAHLLY
jgi:hypothetical protein